MPITPGTGSRPNMSLPDLAPLMLRRQLLCRRCHNVAIPSVATPSATLTIEL
jgi:hypothetical protein